MCNHRNLHLFDAQRPKISHQRSGLFVRAWCARVWHLRFRVCVMTRTHAEMKYKQNYGTFHVYYPCCSCVFVCNLYITVCVCMYSYVTRLICSFVTRTYSYVFRIYSYVTRIYSYVTCMCSFDTRTYSSSYVSRMFLVYTRRLLVCYSYVLVCYSYVAMC